MNSSKKNNTFVGVMLLGIFALSFTFHADAHADKTSNNAIDPFCTGVDVTPRMQAVCTKLVGRAKNWEEAAMFSLHRISRIANKSVPSLLTAIERKLAPNDPFQVAQIIDTCKNNYQFAIEKLKWCETLIKDGPFSEYGSTLTSIYSSFEECERSIVREPGRSDIEEVTNFTKHIERLIDIALIISKKDPRQQDYDVKLAKGQFKDSPGDPTIIGSITQLFYGAHH